MASPGPAIKHGLNHAACFSTYLFISSDIDPSANIKGGLSTSHKTLMNAYFLLFLLGAISHM
jgi:hypothetical protein